MMLRKLISESRQYTIKKETIFFKILTHFWILRGAKKFLNTNTYLKREKKRKESKISFLSSENISNKSKI